VARQEWQLRSTLNVCHPSKAERCSHFAERCCQNDSHKLLSCMLLL